MRRREFMTIVGGAATWPLAARAQQTPMPVIGLLTSKASDDSPHLLAAIRQGLKDTGFVEGQNVVIEYRFAGNHNEQLPALVADLIHRQVNVIAATGTPAALAARAATTTIPIIFTTSGDPVRLGLVASLNRPGGNVTGATQTSVEIAPKRLQLLHELVPTANVVALLVNPDNPVIAEANTKGAQLAASTLGLQLKVINARNESDFDSVFANLIQLQAGGLVIGPDPYFTSQQERLAALAVRYAVPVVYESREFAMAGGLLGYGADVTDGYRVAGVYTGRILRGEKPAELPVQQTTKVIMVINLKAAKALGISVPNTLIGRADEVIE